MMECSLALSEVPAPLSWCSTFASARATAGVHVALRHAMTLATLLLWVVIGLIAGWLASAVVGGGYGLVGDIVVGVVGAFVGGLIFGQLNITVPFTGIAGTIFVAFVGAIALLLLLRLVARGRQRSA
jgi:uncharacterized membrane protein YeaQ/YmgE (transglycosylase-associated protein family)